MPVPQITVPSVLRIFNLKHAFDLHSLCSLQPHKLPLQYLPPKLLAIMLLKEVRYGLTLLWTMVKPAGTVCRDSLTIHWPMVKPAGTVWHYTDLWSNLQWESDTTQTYGKTCRGQSDTTLTYSQTCKESLTLHWLAVKPADSLTLHWTVVTPAGTVWHYTELWSNLQRQSETTDSKLSQNVILSINWWVILWIKRTNTSSHIPHKHKNLTFSWVKMRLYP